MLLQLRPADKAGTCARDRQRAGQHKQHIQHHRAAAPSVQTLGKIGDCMHTTILNQLEPPTEPHEQP